MDNLPFLLRLILSAAYIVGGCYVIYLKPLESPPMDYIFGIAIIVHGIFRGWRAYKVRQEEKVEQ